MFLLPLLLPPSIVALQSVNVEGDMQTQQDCLKPGMDCLNSASSTTANLAEHVRAMMGNAEPVIPPNPNMDTDYSSNSMVSHLTEVYESQGGQSFDSTLGSGGVASSAQYGMNLNQCMQELDRTSGKIRLQESEVLQLREMVVGSQEILGRAESLNQQIWNSETGFATLLQNLFTMYNTAAVRSNTLEAWMADEKHVRDEISSVYRVLDHKSIEQSEELFGLTSTLRAALVKMQTIHDHVSQVLTSVANAETAMYEWAYNVTMKVNSQRTKIVNLAQSLQYRIDQVDNANRELGKMAQVFLQLATKYQDADLIDQAQGMLSQYQLQPNSLSPSLDSHRPSFIPPASPSPSTPISPSTLPPSSAEASGGAVSGSPRLVSSADGGQNMAPALDAAVPTLEEQADVPTLESQAS